MLFAINTKIPTGDLSLDMTICKTNDIISMISSGQRLFGLDIGKKTIGLALSDRELKIASPVKTLYRTKFTQDATSLLKMIDAESIGGLVLGWPVNMDGSIGNHLTSTTSSVILKEWSNHCGNSLGSSELAAIGTTTTGCSSVW